MQWRKLDARWLLQDGEFFLADPEQGCYLLVEPCLFKQSLPADLRRRFFAVLTDVWSEPHASDPAAILTSIGQGLVRRSHLREHPEVSRVFAAGVCCMVDREPFRCRLAAAGKSQAWLLKPNARPAALFEGEPADQEAYLGGRVQNVRVATIPTALGEGDRLLLFTEGGLPLIHELEREGAGSWWQDPLTALDQLERGRLDRPATVVVLEPSDLSLTREKVES